MVASLIRSAALLRCVLLVFGVLLLVVPPAFAQPADTLALNIEDVITRAVEISPDIGEVRADRDFAAARSRLAKSSRFLTEFNATTAHAFAPGLDRPNPGTPTDALYLDPDVRNDWSNASPFNQIEVEALQPIYTWGELGGSIRAARHGVAVEEAAVERKELEVALRAADLYYNVLLTNELFRLAERTGDVLQQAKREIERLQQEGDPSMDDADLFQVQITEQEYYRRVVEVTQNRITARVALARQLFLPEGTVVVPANDVLEPIGFVPEPLETYFDIAMQQRPELAQARAGLAARDALVTVARSDYYPKFFLGFRARYAYADNRFRQRNPYIGDPFLSRTVEAGLGLRQQLNFFQTRSKVDQARAEKEQVRYQLEGAQQLILVQVEQAYRNLLVEQAALAAQDSSLTITNEWLRVEYINFDLELGDTENLVKAVQANLELEARYYEAVRRYNMAVLRLLNAVGILTDRAQSGTLVE
jgi:outer membrane protein TolC